jgi:hypothetical protein
LRYKARLGAEDFLTEFAQGYCAAKRSNFWPPAPIDLRKSRMVALAQCDQQNIKQQSDKVAELV